MAAKPKLYNGWFCPFAQRAWIAFLAKGIEFEYIEQDPYKKTPEWLAVNPKGLVPTIVHQGKSVYESALCVEYIDEAWQNENHLLPTDPYQRFRVRFWSTHISNKMVPAFYSVLLKQGTLEQSESKKEILVSLETLVNAMDPEGPFFDGATLNMVDIMLAPFALRFQTVLPHYRGLTIPDNDKWKRYYTWYNAVAEHESVKPTFPETDKLLKIYERYADGTARSQVADQIRRGKQLT